MWEQIYFSIFIFYQPFDGGADMGQEQEDDKGAQGPHGYFHVPLPG